MKNVFGEDFHSENFLWPVSFFTHVDFTERASPNYLHELEIVFADFDAEI